MSRMDRIRARRERETNVKSSAIASNSISYPVDPENPVILSIPYSDPIHDRNQMRWNCRSSCSRVNTSAVGRPCGQW
jgi:hypothetical protein